MVRRLVLYSLLVLTTLLLNGIKSEAFPAVAPYSPGSRRALRSSADYPAFTSNAPGVISSAAAEHSPLTARSLTSGNGCALMPDGIVYPAPPSASSADGSTRSGVSGPVYYTQGYISLSQTTACAGTTVSVTGKALEVVEIDLGSAPYSPNATLVVDTCGSSPTSSDTILYVGAGCPTNWTVRE